MDLSLATPATEQPMYRCPGERYDIDRSTHLGRLANFYSKCQTCPHHNDTGTLSKKVVHRLGQVQRRAPSATARTGEILQGEVGLSLTVDLARSIARQFGVWLQKQNNADAAPRVQLAGDGRSLAAPLVAAIGEGLTWAGCQVIDIGQVMAPAAVDAQAELEAIGTITVGNPPGQPQTAGIRLFGPLGRPLSIDEVSKDRMVAGEGLSRPTRHAPPALRASVERAYVGRLRQYFHGLRPLRFILDTPSVTVIDWMTKLLDQVACSAILLRGSSRHVGASVPEHHAGLKHGQRHQKPREIQQAAREEAAHFAARIDGDGHALEVWDETGRKLSPTELFVVLSTLGHLDHPPNHLAVSDHDYGKVSDSLTAAGFTGTVVDVGDLDFHQAMLDYDAELGLRPDGRIWHRNRVPMVDAMQSLASLLVALSQSDRPLSAVVGQE